MSQPAHKRAPRGQQSAGQRAQYAAEAEVTHAIEREHQSPEAAGAQASTVEREDGDIAWMRPSNLDAPPARPGYVQRWKRSELGGAPDTRNWQSALREGWRPRPADTVPDAFSMMKTHDNGQGVIKAEGLILCEMPDHAAGQRVAHYRGKTARQIQGVDQDLHRTQAAGGGLPINKEHDSRTETGRRPRVAAD